MKLYLAGPMSGHAEHNFPAFYAAADALRTQGFVVVNPAELDDEEGGPPAEGSAPPGSDAWARYLRRDIALLLGCDGIALLPGFNRSMGASLERHVARALRMPAFHVRAFWPGEAPRAIPEVIVGLSGYAGAGKDEVAKGLVHHLDFNRVAFADALKAASVALDPRLAGEEYAFLSDVIEAHGSLEAAKNGVAVVREFLQSFGVSMRDHVSEDVWVRAALDAAEGILADPKLMPRVVITDVRFPNEVAGVRALGGYLGYIRRPGLGAVNGHVSESLAARFDGGHEEPDFDLTNDGTLGVLLGRALHAAHDLMAHHEKVALGRAVRFTTASRYC